MRRWSMWAGVAIVLAGARCTAAGPGRGPPDSPQTPLPPAQAPAFVPDPGKPWWRFFTDGEWYFEFGSDKEFWSNPDIHVSQPALGNNFTIYDVKGHDAPAGAGEAPQYNIRVGRFFNENWGVELNIDHSKYYTDIGQTAQVSGLIAGVPVSGPRQLDNFFFNEQLHNGANHVMLDAVYRYPLIGQTNETNSLAAIGKVGIGVMLPHTSDIILGNPNNVGLKTWSNLIGINSGWWQLNGWTTGIESRPSLRGVQAVLPRADQQGSVFELRQSAGLPGNHVAGDVDGGDRPHARLHL